jgi:predicted N-acetyltransferase YhbS
MTKSDTVNIRALKPDDLDAVVEIDTGLVGRSRRGFFEKRLEAAIAAPDDFVIIGTDEGQSLKGYVFTRIQGGDFGEHGKTAVLDVIGVSPDAQSKGLGRGLIENLDQRLEKREVREIRTLAEWRFHPLLKFFDAAGFDLAPTHVFESAVPGVIAPTDASSAGDGDVRDVDLEFQSPGDIQFRPMRAEDLDSLVSIDRRITDRDRRQYYQHKIAEMLDQTGIRASRVAEIDGDVVGVVMARVDYGEFGRTEPVAVMDTITVDPGYRHRGVGHELMSQLLVNLDAVDVEAVHTNVDWENFDMLSFLGSCGFQPSQRLVFRRPVPRNH